ncbi:excinuclease, partial [Vibrio anguillarum]|nr:excinuclease [Vibrio anguillarum]
MPTHGDFGAKLKFSVYGVFLSSVVR